MAQGLLHRASRSSARHCNQVDGLTCSCAAEQADRATLAKRICSWTWMTPTSKSSLCPSRTILAAHVSVFSPLKQQALYGHTQHASSSQLIASQYGTHQRPQNRSVLLHGTARTSTAAPAATFHIEQYPTLARVSALFVVLIRNSAANKAALMVGLEPLTVFVIQQSSCA